MPAPLDQAQISANVRVALHEDIGDQDVSAALLPDGPGRARVICREPAVIAGQPWFDECFRQIDPGSEILWRVQEGQRVDADSEICQIQSSKRCIVSAERTALNFLQTLSATATATAHLVDQLRGTSTRILDTRKTLPGLRYAQKYAVRVGGGSNHRMGLYDAIMLKENHISASGSIADAALKAKQRFPDLPLIIEVETMDELREALDTACDRILIDEFSIEQMREAVALSKARKPLEASGNISGDQLKAIAATGVDFISSGSLTKHIRASDFSLRMLSD